MVVKIPPEYLNSDKIHNGYVFIYDGDIFDNRFSVIKKIVNGMNNVIDLGCVGYVPNIKKAIDSNTYLHGILTENCHNVLGVDIEDDGIKYIKNIGYKNVMIADIVKDSDAIKEWFDGRIELIVIGEMLHEVDNPSWLLSEIKHKYEGIVNQILITVPNIYRFENIVNGLKGNDINHTENRYWFSPYTLCKLVACAGMQPKEIYLAGKLKGKKGLLLSLFKNNICSEHIVLLCEL